MTYTIKLSDDGGISFDSNGRLVMIGTPNQVSSQEVEQRTRIRFETQTRSNLLHLNEGFDFFSLKVAKHYNADRAVKNMEKLIEYAIKATLQQDPDIDVDSALITISRIDNREYQAEVLIKVKGNFEENIRFIGSLGNV